MVKEALMLEVNELKKSFGGLEAVSDCSLEVKRGTITGLIGPNGAGKTTLFNLITGFYKPDQGEIIFSWANPSSSTKTFRPTTCELKFIEVCRGFPSFYPHISYLVGR